MYASTTGMAKLFRIPKSWTQRQAGMGEQGRSNGGGN